MGVATEGPYLVHHKVKGYTFGERGELSPFMIQCGRITAPADGYREVWHDATGKMIAEEMPPLDKPEFLRWPENSSKSEKQYPYPGRPVLIKTRAEAQRMIDSGEAAKLRAEYYASREQAELDLREKALLQATKVSGGALAGVIAAAVSAAVNPTPVEEKRGPGRPRNEAPTGV